MTEDQEAQFLPLGSENVQNSKKRIHIPKSVYKLQILTHPSEIPDDPETEDAIGFAHWAYDRKTGWPIISDRPLSNKTLKPFEGEIPCDTERVRFEEPQRRKEYVTQQSNDFVSIPKPFFNITDPNKYSIESGVPDAAHFEHGQERYFVTTRLALSNQPNDVKSMFVLNSRQMQTVMNNSPNLRGEIVTPQFS